ncbi:hypothetical protein Sipo8835_05970 [Streptomyces ipomoeae]|uniref:Uncharacterized protein n=2 Tax=Streptomyces ipomoeae TaxID=103232 RepID=L1KM76_9ACTN|nr:hypothetical protein [Streptomyces ipomoeae]EKX61590.1 hypothetical protein STRIP9103_00167 [Streptomyces ipomoeae 91-03]MDX2693348.1 hypothetical protein [Streptomyces ipomoeae]MDX2838953.1 hypothetical protein [Streptomyces ipomoeae]TQE38247.1 hypothetical protein Sipo8835_05970 [Streptomyces ipomoeae]
MCAAHLSKEPRGASGSAEVLEARRSIDTDVDRTRQASLRRFDLEDGFRLFKQPWLDPAGGCGSRKRPTGGTG